MPLRVVPTRDVGVRKPNTPFVTDVAFGSAAQRQDVRQREQPRSRWSVAG